MKRHLVWNSLLLVLLLSALLLSSGCKATSLPVDKVVLEAVPEGTPTKTISTTKLASNISIGGRIGSAYAGVDQLYLRNVNLTKLMLDNFLKGTFLLLKNNNYNVIGNPDDLFDDASGFAEIQLGIRVVDITFNIFYNVFFVRLQSGKATAQVEVEWQIYNSLDKKVVYKTTTTGTGNDTFESPSGDALYNAYRNAFEKLLNDERFRQILTEPASAGVPQEIPESLSGYPVRYASAQSTRTMEDVQKSVVTIRVGSGHGSGFVLSSNGLVITNQHVVGDSAKARVVAHDGRQFDGVVVMRDARRDVAAIVVKNLPYPPLLVRQQPMAIGEDIFALGSPLETGLFGTVTKGIVSSNRMMNKQPWIQGDATINPGNSGGPIVDAKGNVAGISTLARRNAQGIYFYGPIADALKKLGIQPK